MNAALTRAKFLFEKFSNDKAVALLQSLPNLAERTFEDDWLDFKTGKTQDQDLKRIWSRAIGGFANNEGGVLVWGIRCEKDKSTGVDSVDAVELVPDVFKLKSRLMELRHVATDPPVADIQIRELPISSSSPEGFLVCYIPESNVKPHRSEFANKLFYIRMGDASRECSVSLLRQLFYPKRNPRLQVQVKRVQRPRGLVLRRIGSSPEGDHIRGIVEFSITNIGETSVDDVLFRVTCEGYELMTYRYSDITQKYDVEFLAPVVEVGGAIHPKIRRAVNIVLLSEVPKPPADWKIRVYARDMLPRDATLQFVEKDGDSLKVECLP
jgi:hypothetical protein